MFGDGVADVTMLQLADLGIAMGNAPDSVKRCADYVPFPAMKTVWLWLWKTLFWPKCVKARFRSMP